MDHWDLTTLAVEPRHPQILQSARGEARAIAILTRDEAPSYRILS